MKTFLAFSTLLLLYAQLANGQSVSIPAQGMDVQVVSVPASTPATFLNVTVDASSNGSDFIDVISSNSQILISLILPAGTEVTPTNASSFGFTVSQIVNTAGVPVVSGVFTPFDAIGSHTIFMLPAGSPSAQCTTMTGVLNAIQQIQPVN